MGRPAAQAPGGALYAAFWRWHFHAGLLVLPVLMLMALTGGLYLFRGEIEGALYRPLLRVEASPQATDPETWARAARAAAPGARLVQLAPPAGPTVSARLMVETPQGRRLAIYVDPHTGRVLGQTPDGGVMQVVKRLHSLEIAGPVANMLVELAAGWAIVMVATGVVLWWPRGGSGGVVSVRSTPRRRVFWRDLHAVTGVFSCAVILFLAVTGMPWSAVWGQQVRKLTNEAGWGAPKPPAGVRAGTHAGHVPADEGALPWSLQDREMRMAHVGHAQAPGLDGMVAAADAAGLARPYALTIPADPGQVWSASRTVRRVEDTRTLYLDGATGRVIDDIGYARFGPAAKAIQWGVAVHQGEEFGPFNRYVMLAGCVAIWLLGISAVVMWWKRRPAGALAAPPRTADRRAQLALALVITPLGLIYPLVGLSIVVILALDGLSRRFFVKVLAKQEIRA